MLQLTGAVMGSTTVAQLAAALLCAENSGEDADDSEVAGKKRAIVSLCTDASSWAAALAAKGCLTSR